MKKGVIAFLFSIFIIPLINAQFFDSYSFSPSDILASIDAQTIFILISFSVIAVVLKIILDRIPAFKGKMAGVISVLISLGATWGINKWFSLNDFLLDIGFSGDILFYLAIAFLVLLVFLCWKYKWRTFLILGLILILMALFTELFNNPEFFLVLGVILFGIGLIWAWKSRNKPPKLPGGNPAASPQAAAQQQANYKQRTDLEKMNLARKIGIRNLYSEYSKLEQEYNRGVGNAKDLHKKATQLGWNKTKEGNEYYKAWYRQYQRLDQLRNGMKDIQQRIEYLKKQIK